LSVLGKFFLVSRAHFHYRILCCFKAMNCITCGTYTGPDGPVMCSRCKLAGLFLPWTRESKILFVLFAIGIAICAFVDESSKPHHSPEGETDTPEVASAPPSPPPTPQFATVRDAEAEAVRRYPELGTAGSRLNMEFVARYNQYKHTRPAYFNDTSWPIRLAEEIIRSPESTK